VSLLQTPCSRGPAVKRWPGRRCRGLPSLLGQAQGVVEAEGVIVGRQHLFGVWRRCASDELDPGPLCAGTRWAALARSRSGSLRVR